MGCPYSLGGTPLFQLTPNQTLEKMGLTHLVHLTKHYLKGFACLNLFIYNENCIHLACH